MAATILTDEYITEELVPGDTPFEKSDSLCKGLLIRVEPSGSKTWVLLLWTPDTSGKRQRYRWRLGGFPTYRCYLNTPKTAAVRSRSVRDVAEDIKAQARTTDLRQAKAEAKASAAAGAFSTLDTFITGPYLDFQKKKGRRNPEDTCKYQKAAFQELLDKRIDQIAYFDIQRWLKKAEKKLQPGSIKRRLGFLSSVLNRAIIEGLIESHPLQKKERERRETFIAIPKPPKGKIRYLSRGEEQRLRAALVARDAELKAQRARTIIHRQTRQQDAPAAINGPYGDHLTPLVLIALNTGIRKGALLGLKWSDITPQQVTVSRELDKSKHGYSVVLSDEAREVLRLWKHQSGGKDSDFIFRYHDQPISSVKTSWNSVLEAAQIDNFRFHDLRHSFASKLVMAGIPLFTVSQLLGHRNLDTTMIYAHLSPDHMADALKVLNQ